MLKVGAICYGLLKSVTISKRIMLPSHTRAKLVHKILRIKDLADASMMSEYCKLRVRKVVES